LPSIDDQKKVVVHLENLQEKLRELLEIQNKNLRDIEALFPSLLERAFKIQPEKA
jgi:hypothetical protein